MSNEDLGDEDVTRVSDVDLLDLCLLRGELAVSLDENHPLEGRVADCDERMERIRLEMRSIRRELVRLVELNR